MASSSQSGKGQSQQVLMQQIHKMFSNNNNALIKERGSLNFASRRGGHSRTELELAVVVLLVDLASCDQNFDPQEYEVIVNGLRRLFGTQRHEVRALVNQANLLLSSLRGPAKFAELLAKALSVEQKNQVMEVIDECIMADSIEDGYETYLRHKFAEMLGIKQ